MSNYPSEIGSSDHWNVKQDGRFEGAYHQDHSRTSGFPRQDRWTWAALGVMAGLWAIGVGWLAIQRHLAFKTNGDMGIFVQAIWTTAHGRPFYVTVFGGETNFLGHHFAPLLAVLTPVYRLWPDARCLLVIQVALLALAVVPLYVFARPRTRRIGRLVGCCSLSTLSSPTLRCAFGFPRDQLDRSLADGGRRSADEQPSCARPLFGWCWQCC